jgi:hypothetical protein
MLRSVTSHPPAGARCPLCDRLPNSPAFSSRQTPAHSSRITSHKSAITAFRFATHSKTGIAVTPRKQTTEPIPVRNKFRGVRTSNSGRISAQISARFAASSAGSASLSRVSQCHPRIARLEKVRIRAYSLPARFAFPSGTQSLGSCRMNSLGREI